MGNVINYRIARAPDKSLYVRGAANGWNLLTSAKSAVAVTASPAGLLLTPAQIQAIPPLAAINGKAPASVKLFDPLHNALEAAFDRDDFATMDKLARAFLAKNPIGKTQALNETEKAIRRFFIYKGSSSTAAERLRLIEGLSVEARTAWNRAAPARIDLEKAQALATAVSGIKPPRDSDLLGGLRADLAFATLEACYAAMPRDDRPRLLPNGYIEAVLEMKPFLPPFVFQLEVCKKAGGQSTVELGLLAKRLDRLATYQKRVGEMAKRAGTPQTVAVATTTDVVVDKCPCDCNHPECQPIDPCCGEIRHYFTELITLKDWTWCYKPSDIAYIENVAPYETRIRTHGFTRTVVETSEDETTTSREESLDHQVTDRFNLQTEMTKNLKASLDVDAKLHYGKPGGSFTADLNTHGSLSRETAYREAREQVREQVEHATLKMQVQTRKLRSRNVTTEQTETNKHKFKNTTAIAAVSKYFWVTQEKRGQLFSHGPRLHVDMLVPSPAMLFLKLEEMKRKAGEPKPPVKPPYPQVDEKDLVPGLIQRDNYEALCIKNGIYEYAAPPPQPGDYDGGSVTFEAGAEWNPTIEVPAGYHITKMWVSDRYCLPPPLFPIPGIYVAFKLGGYSVRVYQVPGSSWDEANINISSDSTADIDNAGFWPQWTGTVTFRFTAYPVDLGPWQKELFKAIMEKYTKDLEKYEEKFADYEAALKAYYAEQDDKIKGRHPFACEEIMRTELKRSAIFMMCGEFDWPGVMNMDSELCHLPWPNRKKADEATNEWYFFDRAFDWNLASFIFYDYFRNPICKWVDSFEPDEPNFLFKAFKRAGYARIMVPVAPGMEEQVQTYLQSGAIWGKSGGTWPHDPSDSNWISVIDEIKHARGCYQQDRKGYVEALPDTNGNFDSHIKVFTDYYWDVFNPGGIDQDEINLELDHQIYIDGVEYRITSIIPDPDSEDYDEYTPNQMSWIMGLDRKIEFAPWIDPDASTPLLKRYNWAVGAKYVGAPFHFDLPTDLIWIGDQGNACLPCYPIDCECPPKVEQLPDLTGGDCGAGGDDRGCDDGDDDCEGGSDDGDCVGDGEREKPFGEDE